MQILWRTMFINRLSDKNGNKKKVNSPKLLNKICHLLIFLHIILQHENSICIKNHKYHVISYDARTLKKYGDILIEFSKMPYFFEKLEAM